MYTQTEASFRGLLPLLKPHIRKLILGGVSMSIYVICWPLLAWLAGELIPSIGDGDFLKVSRVIILALFVFLVQKIAQFIQDTILAGPALFISQELRSDVFRKLQRVELTRLEKLSSGDIAYRLTEDADRVGEVIYKTIQDTTPCLLQLVAVFAYMLYLDWRLSIATLLLAPIVTLLVSNFGAKVMHAAEISQRQVSDLAGLLGEAIQSLSLVRAFAAEEWMQKRFNKEINLHRKARFRTLRLLAFQHPVVGFIEASGILGILAIGAARIQSGGLDSQGFSSFIAALLMLIDPISHLTTNFNEFKQGQASLRRLRELEKEPCEQIDIPNATVIKKGTGQILIKDLSFSYVAEKEVLKEIDIKIMPGQVVALVGPSGAGKSTLFSLLLRFIKPQKGNIYFDGHDLYKIRVQDLRKQIALVPQRVTVLSGTILEAIKFGRNATKKEVEKAALIANAHDFISELPDGYETKLEERGTNVSGGQLQRIAIARAVLGNPSVLLLDEATSSLDAEAESAVQLALSQAMQNRTVLVIAHRLSTVQEADQIIVLERGSVAQQGNHDELISKGGRYKELCSRQLIRHQ